jgi:hypothetical protein
MAKSIMTQPTLFGRLQKARATVKVARVEIETLRGSMNRKSEPVPGSGGWAPAKDLHIQLGQALKMLDEALDSMTPGEFHIDQPVRKTREAPHV